MRKHLTMQQVERLNEKHGYFQFGDAQGEVSVGFANDAIAMHETLRSAAPELLIACRAAWNLIAELPTSRVNAEVCLMLEKALVNAGEEI